MNQPHSPQRASGTPAHDDLGAPLALPGRRAIVAGFGLVGRMTAERLRAAGVKVTLIELNSHTIERQASLDRQVVYGNVTDPQTLQQAGVDSADVLVLTLPDSEAAVRACGVARELNPDIFIAVRTSFVSQGMLATQAGADHVIVDEAIAAEAMQQAVMKRLVK